MNQTSKYLLRLLSPLAATLAIFLLPGIRFAEPVWLTGGSVLLMAGMMAAAFLIGHVLLLTPIFSSDRILKRLMTVIAVGALVSLPVFLYFLVMDIDISRLIVIFETGLLFFLLITNSFQKLTIPAFIVNLIILCVAIFSSLPGLSKDGPTKGKPVEFDSSVSFEFANYHDVKITKHKIFNEKELANGGSIDTIDDSRILLVTGYGRFSIIDTSENDFDIKALNIRAPINSDTYLAEAKTPTLYFRVTDILLEEADSNTRKLYVAHHYLHSDKQCYTLRLSETQLDIQKLTIGEWVTRYDTEPCVKINAFSNLTGGRLALDNDGTILLTVGAHSYDTREFASLKDSHYGRIMHIDPADWSARVYSKGHRNPQGLHVSSYGIWSTEHGPEGGDELNLIEYGVDYGWPASTFGTDYGKKTYEDALPGQYLYGRLPLYAWVPSIGISNLIEVTGDEFIAWKNDLLVTSLNGMSIFRVRNRDGRAVNIERLKTGERIRDITELPSGKIVLWNGKDTIQILESASSAFSECKGCHVLSTAAQSIGPDLARIVGRKVASREGYAYSEGMRKFGGEWTLERLDAFIKDPAKTVPGTSMQFQGIAEADKRKEIVQFLNQQLKHSPDDRR